MFALLFGVSIFAVSTVLAAFMAGLALGGYSFGHWIDRFRRPLLVFAALELGIGTFAAFFPKIFSGIGALYLYIYNSVSPSFYTYRFIQFVVAFLLLLVPTFLMGGTLPVLAKHCVRALSSLGWRVGSLYSVNNFGAVLGAFGAGFFLIRILGTSTTLQLAAAINLLIGLVVFFLMRPFNEETASTKQSVKAEEQESRYSKKIIRIVLWVFAIEGFLSLAYQVLLVRVLAVFFEDAVYSFATLVVTFLCGLSIGSMIAARFVDRIKKLLLVFGLIEAMIGVAILGLLPVLKSIPLIMTILRHSLGATWWGYTSVEFLIAFIAMLIPTMLMGTTFPLVSKIYTLRLDKVGSRIGDVSALDTVGSIAGSIVAGFILIPLFGIHFSIIVVAVINVAIGLWVVGLEPVMRNKRRVVIASLVVSVLLLGYSISLSRDYLKFWQERKPGDKLLFYEEGPTAAVATVQEKQWQEGVLENVGVKKLAINGKVTAFTTYEDLQVHKMLAYIPFFFCDNPQKGLVIGLGMGVTAHSLLEAGMTEVHCVEIAPEVVRASRHFLEFNGDLLKKSGFDLTVEDGRTYLLTTNIQYDLVTSNAIHPKLSPNLYTKDFYEIAGKKLSPRGIMTQWLPTNWLSEQEIKMLIHSFAEVFPYSNLWYINPYHSILVGSKEEVQLNFNRFENRMMKQAVQKDLAPLNMSNPFSFLCFFSMNEESVREYAKGASSNTDDSPHVEYSQWHDKRANFPVIRKLAKGRADELIGLLEVGNDEAGREEIIQKVELYMKAREYARMGEMFGWMGMIREEIELYKLALSVYPYEEHIRHLAIRALGEWRSLGSRPR